MEAVCALGCDPCGIERSQHWLLDQPFALERLHHVFDLVVIQHGAELTNDLFDAVTYPRLTDAVGGGLVHGDLKNSAAVIPVDVVQQAHDSSSAILASSAVFSAFSY